MWCGVSIIAVAVLMVGYSPMLAAPSADASTAPSSNVMVFGVLITLAGTFVQSVRGAEGMHWCTRVWGTRAHWSDSPSIELRVVIPLVCFFADTIHIRGEGDGRGG